MVASIASEIASNIVPPVMIMKIHYVSDNGAIVLLS
jgi:hypothetical protein